MPIYEYKCKTCGLEFELLIYSGDKAKCPVCNSEELFKKVSLPNFVGGSNNSNSSSLNNNPCGGCTATSCATCKSK